MVQINAKKCPEELNCYRAGGSIKGSVLSIVNLHLTPPTPLRHSRAVARKLRVQYPGAIYHVMNRGDHREAIFRSNKDREVFLQTLGQACQKTDWQVMPGP